MAEVKPGWKTTEFWVCAVVLTAALVVPLFAPEQHVVARVAELVVAIAACIGYTVARAKVKIAETLKVSEDAVANLEQLLRKQGGSR